LRVLVLAIMRAWDPEPGQDGVTLSVLIMSSQQYSQLKHKLTSVLLKLAATA